MAATPTCGICLEASRKAYKLMVTPCLHGLHASCLTAWVRVAAKTHVTGERLRVASITCPMCRTLLVFTPLGKGYVLAPANAHAHNTFLTHVHLRKASDQVAVRRVWERCMGGGGQPVAATRAEREVWWDEEEAWQREAAELAPPPSPHPDDWDDV